MGWLNGYDKRIKLTVSNTNIDAELTWFPVTVFLTSTQGEEVFAEFDADADFDRVAFTTSDESTQLYADCELFDDSESKAIYHIAKTGVAISNTGTTDFYMYYDNDAAHNTTYISASGGTAAQSVWDGNFKAVYHMADGASTSAIYDSTSNNNDGTKKGANEPVEAAGKVGLAQDFNGTDEYITLPDLALSTPFTVEIVATPDAIDGSGVILGIDNTGITPVGVALGFYDGTDEIMIGNVDFQKGLDDISAYLTNGTANHWCDVVNASDDIDFYLDGADMVSDLDTTTYWTNNADYYLIGARQAAEYYSRFFNGKVSEVRISSSTRNAAWIKATYNSLWDTLLTYGSEETGGVTYNAINFGMNF